MNLRKPSRFALGNFALIMLILLVSVATLYALNPNFVYVYICGAVTFYATIKFYHYRVRRHTYLNPPSYAEFVYNMQTGLDQLQSDFDGFMTQVNIYTYTPTTGGET